MLWKSLLQCLSRACGLLQRIKNASIFRVMWEAPFMSKQREQAVVFLDLLGFGKAVKDDTASAVRLLEDYATALREAVQDAKVHPAASYSSQDLRRIAEHSAATSFHHFLPMSDSVFIVSDAPADLVSQLSHFLVDCFWPNIGAYLAPEKADPRSVSIKHTTFSKNGVRTSVEREQWLPVLFRGGASWGEVHVYNSPSIAAGELRSQANLMGKAVVEAVGLEKAGFKGPVLLCTARFAGTVTGDATAYLRKVAVSGDELWEICWPIALFETSSSLDDALQNEFGQFLRAVLALLKYFAATPLEDQYLAFARLAIRSALHRFPETRPVLLRHVTQTVADVALVECLFFPEVQ